MSLIRADARFLPIARDTIDCCVTSPPYFGLRDYGHAGQIGLEPTPAAYVASLVAVFREVRRVLKDDGTLWLNLGDSYAANGGAHGGRQDNQGGVGAARVHREGGGDQIARSAPDGLKAKDLIGVPWLVAFALQADGWYLRSDIIWSKPNPMPESVTDRPTKAHEYLFLLAKSERYYYDAAAIAEPAAYPQGSGNTRPYTVPGQRRGDNANLGGGLHKIGPRETRNCRSVWTVNAQPYDGAHFATMPEALVEPCIRAGCPVGGIVLDPFIGSGTVGEVAERTCRRWVGTDLSYQELAVTRTAQRGLMFL